MRQDDVIRLRHITDAARTALGFVRHRQREDLDHDRQLVWALVKAIEIIGEASAQLSEEVKNQISAIPWRNIIGMRNRLVHAYFDINLDILWKTVTDGLPPIVAEIEDVIPEDN